MIDLFIIIKADIIMAAYGAMELTTLEGIDIMADDIIADKDHTHHCI